MKELLGSVNLIVDEALKRDDIGITGIDIGAEQILVFTNSAGARQHLANVLGLPAPVRESRFGHLYREGFDGKVRIYGKDTD